MTDATERPEDTVHRFAQQIQELLAWKSRYMEAAVLWDSLETQDNDQIVEAVLIAKLHDFDKGLTQVSISSTDSVDWIGQLGLIAAAKLISDQTPVLGNDDD
jgi:hypothetical protein